MNFAQIVEKYSEKITRWIPLEAIIAYNLIISISPKNLKQHLAALIFSLLVIVIPPFVTNNYIKKRFLTLSLINFFAWAYFIKLSDIVNLGESLNWPAFNSIIFAVVIFGCPIVYFLLKAPPQNVCSDLLDEDIEKLKQDKQYAIAIVSKYKKYITTEEDMIIDSNVLVTMQNNNWLIDRKDWEYSLEISEVPMGDGISRYQLRQTPKLNLPNISFE